MIWGMPFHIERPGACSEAFLASSVHADAMSEMSDSPLWAKISSLLNPMTSMRRTALERMIVA